MVDFELDIKNCISVMEQGGIILYPTDTVWGIGCDALNEEAVAKIYALKQRPKEKSAIVLLPEAKDILKYVAAPPPDIIAIVNAFTKPTTVIYEGALEIARNAVNDSGTVAIRITTDAFCKALLKRYKRPIVSTSANISGQPTATTFLTIDKHIVDGVDYVVQHRQNDTYVPPPSTIIKIDDLGNIEVIRP